MTAHVWKRGRDLHRHLDADGVMLFDFLREIPRGRLIAVQAGPVRCVGPMDEIVNGGLTLVVGRAGATDQYTVLPLAAIDQVEWPAERSPDA